MSDNKVRVAKTVVEIPVLEQHQVWSALSENRADWPVLGNEGHVEDIKLVRAHLVHQGLAFCFFQVSRELFEHLAVFCAVRVKAQLLLADLKDVLLQLIERALFMNDLVG